MSRTIRCCVVHAPSAQRCWCWELELSDGATIADALYEARSLAQRGVPEAAAAGAVDWEHAPVGVFGRSCKRDQRLRDGSRVEIYRALGADPKARRRQRALAQRLR